MIAYIGPFILFMVLLGLQSYTTALGRWEPLLRIVLLSAALFVWSRRVLDFRVRFPFSSIGVGILVFLIWIAPELLFPHYREHWLFKNSLTGGTGLSIAPAFRSDTWVLFLRTLRAVVLVPIIEELFWRSWLMRYLVSPSVEAVPLGTYTASSFWVVAALFAAEHGPYWDVGLAAGVIYNAWMIRTRSLGDCILAHAVTNGVLCGYVLVTQAWQYWQ